MPLGVMVILLAYTLRDLPLADPARALPGIVALAVTVGLHLWRRNAVLSILGGTVVNVALASLLSARLPPAGGHLDQAQLVGVNALSVDAEVRPARSGRRRSPGRRPGSRP